MTMRSRLQRAANILQDIAAHPAVAREYLARLPEYISGRAASAAWPLESSPPLPAALPNALRRYFESVQQGPGIWKWLHYFDVYDRHFKKFVGKPVDLVEIGVYSGGSLGMWQSYFGEQARIYGIDIEPACKVYERPGVQIFIGDQADKEFWKRFNVSVNGYDIVIDDGGHLSHQQIATLEETLPRLRPGGVYVCEDVHNTGNRFSAYALALVDELNAWRATEIVDDKHLVAQSSTFQRAAFSIHIYPFMVVIEREQSPLARLESVKHGTEWQPFLK